MAEFYFYAAWADSLNCITRINALNRYSFAVRMSHEHNKPPLFTVIRDENLKLVKKGYPLLILRKQSIPTWSFIRTEKNPKFMINTEKSGPLLELRLPHETEKEGKMYITLGWLTYPSKLVNPKTLLKTEMPQYIRQEYKLLQKDLQKEMRRYYIIAHKRDRSGTMVSYQMPLWVGLHGLDMLKNRKAAIPFGNSVIGISDLHDSILARK